MNARTLEICVDSAASLDAAIAGGADRIELCAALALGGLTPPRSFMRHATGRAIPVYAIVRPRSGAFVFDPNEVHMMLRDITDVHEAGLAGVVLGASRPDGRLDETVLAALHDRAVALGLRATLHRAFDMAPDPEQALETAIALGFERVLTSGGATTALAGIETLKRLYARAGGRIKLMPGAGISPENIGMIARQLSVDNMHASASISASSVVQPSRGFSSGSGSAGDTRRETDASVVQSLHQNWKEAVRNP